MRPREELRGNRLLQLLRASGRADLGPQIPVQLTARQVVKAPGQPTLYVYFPMTAVVSLVTTMESGASTEVALIGREGLVGLAGVLGTVETTTSAVVQVTGQAVHVSTAALRAARAANPSVRNTLDLYTQARLVQFAQTAACSRLHPIEARLARWLLAIHDRIVGDEFVVSQEFIAEMLGVHRPTVSTALQRLQDQVAIRRRGRAIVIVDRRGLEAHACECHRVIDREFERLLTPRAGPERLVSATHLSTTQTGDTNTTLEALRDIAGRLLLASIREQEAREDAEAANRANDQFLATVSHELRNPLNVILGWCAVLTAHADRPTEPGLDIIARNARAQLALVNELLDAARVTSSTLTIHPVPVCLDTLVYDVVEGIRPGADAKGVGLVVVAAADTPSWVFGDVDRLRQVLLNILTNALKFTDSGGSIEVRISSRAGRARVMVRDTGRGIAPSLLPHVFDRYRQGRMTDLGQQGLGLGLSIARALVALHDGTIGLDSPGDGQGTTCTIELPLFDDRQAHAAAIIHH